MGTAVWIGIGIIVVAAVAAAIFYVRYWDGDAEEDTVPRAADPELRGMVETPEITDPFEHVAHPAEAMERAVRGVEEPEQKQEKKLDLKLAVPPPRPPGR